MNWITTAVYGGTALALACAAAVGLIYAGQYLL